MQALVIYFRTMKSLRMVGQFIGACLFLLAEGSMAPRCGPLLVDHRGQGLVLYGVL